MEDFARSRAAAEENAISTAFRDSLTGAQGAMTQQLAGQQQVYGQQRDVYNDNFNRGAALTPNATQLGSTQYTEGSTGLRTNAALDAQGRNLGTQLGAQGAISSREDATRRYLGELDARTRKSTAGAGSIGLDGQLALINARAEQDRNTIGYNAGVNAATGMGNETSTSDVAGQIIGAGIGGLTSGIGANLGKRAPYRSSTGI
jgi:hypothetical protein